jgi:hypothetical protein
VPDLFVAPRIVSFAFGLLALLAMSWLALELSGDRRVAAITALLAAVFPQRVVLSLVPLAEIMFIAQVTAGMAGAPRPLDGIPADLGAPGERRRLRPRRHQPATRAGSACTGCRTGIRSSS